MRYRHLSSPVAAALLLAGCGPSVDPAALEKGDAAFGGEMVDGAVQPAAARAVRVGNDGRQADACGALASPTAAPMNVHWTNRASSPVKAAVTGDVWVCETDGDWNGIVFPAAGQSTDDCAVASPVASPREYQGPCRWGWVPTRAISVTAG